MTAIPDQCLSVHQGHLVLMEYVPRALLVPIMIKKVPKNAIPVHLDMNVLTLLTRHRNASQVLSAEVVIPHVPLVGLGRMLSHRELPSVILALMDTNVCLLLNHLRCVELALIPALVMASARIAKLEPLARAVHQTVPIVFLDMIVLIQGLAQWLASQEHSAPVQLANVRIVLQEHIQTKVPLSCV